MESKDLYYITKTWEYITNRLYNKEITMDRAIEIIKKTSILTQYEKMEVLESLREQYTR
jgi:hypothetical protein